jgi:hypothetical protein
MEYVMAGSPRRIDREFPVVLRRTLGLNHDCFLAFDSKTLAQYLEAHPGQGVPVTYTVTYDFFRPRNTQPRSVGQFGPTSGVLLRKYVKMRKGAAQGRSETLLRLVALKKKTLLHRS